MQSKIHKEGNPNRPVIISLNCHTTQILQYFGHNLQPQVQELEFYVKDSTDFLKKVFTIDKVPQEYFFRNHRPLFT